MLFLLLKFLYIIILSYLYGYPIQRLLYNRVLKNIAARSSFALTALTGFFGITALGAILSLFMPIAATAHVIILAGAVIFYLLQRSSINAEMSVYVQQARNASPGIQLFFLAAVLYVTYLSAQQSFTYDEGLYYAQFVKWIQHYPVVPGLANLHYRFGLNSHWHVLAAVFNFSWFTGAGDNHLNGALYLLTVLYMLPGKQDSSFITFLKTGLLVMINMPQLCVYNIIAPAADLPVFYIGLLVILVWLEQSARGESLTEGTGSVFLLLAPIYLVTVKISAVPILLLTAILYLQLLRKKQVVQFALLLVPAVLIMGPWVVRNIILTGYPVYPMQLPAFFHTGWEVPASVIHTLRLHITSFAFYRTADVERLMSESATQRFSAWFMQNLRIYDKVMVLCAFISPLIVFLRRKQLPAGFLSLYFFLMLGLCFWIIQAPDPRFGYSYLAPLLVLTAVLCIPALQKKAVFTLALLAALLFETGTLFLQARLHRAFAAEGLITPVSKQNWITPAPYTIQPVNTQHAPFLMYVPVATELCWDNPLPCVDHLPTGIKMRGSSL
ncbi:MAG TPA: hypothetical protein VJ720_13545, partial [Chitinophaga sp.]|nr:hypothetical protein [Chitinophaga sp.]